jgi:hypothetical protein
MLSASTSTLVPDNVRGIEKDIEHAITLNSVEDAVTRFEIARNRLFRPDCWQELAGKLTAVFKLVDRNGSEKNSAIEIHDYIKIDIPGPGPSAGDHFDWVQVSRIKERFITGADDSIGIQLKPCANPFGTKKVTAHFFMEDASSTFIIKREAANLYAFYCGRNEVPNNKNVDLGDKIRNSLVASAAIACLSEIQWKALITGFLS